MEIPFRERDQHAEKGYLLTNSRMSHKAGFVNILGNPNVGKSTLMNALVGEKISIITPKVQTTRHRIMGIVNGDDFQIVFSDTPGILKPKYKLQESMMSFVNVAMTDADIIIFVSDARESVFKNGEYIEKIKKSAAPVIIVINKIDLTDQPALEGIVESWHSSFPTSEIIPLSATKRFNIDVLLKSIIEKLPDGEAFFPKDQLTDRYERFFASEIIREKILLNYSKEIPYSV